MSSDVFKGDSNQNNVFLISLVKQPTDGKPLTLTKTLIFLNAFESQTRDDSRKRNHLLILQYSRYLNTGDFSQLNNY